MSEDKGMEDLHCPFCGIVLSDSNEEYHSEDFEDEDD